MRVAQCAAMGWATRCRQRDLLGADALLTARLYYGV